MGLEWGNMGIEWGNMGIEWGNMGIDRTCFAMCVFVKIQSSPTHIELLIGLQTRISALVGEQVYPIFEYCFNGTLRWRKRMSVGYCSFNISELLWQCECARTRLQSRSTGLDYLSQTGFEWLLIVYFKLANLCLCGFILIYTSFVLSSMQAKKSGVYECISSRITTVIQVAKYYQIDYNWYNDSLQCMPRLQHANHTWHG